MDAESNIAIRFVDENDYETNYQWNRVCMGDAFSAPLSSLDFFLLSSRLWGKSSGVGRGTLTHYFIARFMVITKCSINIFLRK